MAPTNPSKASFGLFMLLLLLRSDVLGISNDQQILLQYKQRQSSLECSDPDGELDSWDAKADPNKWAGVQFEAGSLVSSLTLYGLCGSLPESFGDLSRLGHLELSYGTSTGTLPVSWGKMTGLTFLRLYGNSFSGTLPESWSNLTGLTSLALQNWHNGLTGFIAFSPVGFNGTLPESWGNLVGLQELEMYGNNFSGPLPETWGKLTGLTSLSLYNNYLTSTLPDAWGKLTGLMSLSLYRNNLAGTLPDAWGKLTRLRQFVLFDNRLTGPLPESWSKITGLVALSLDANSLTGTLPQSFSELTALMYLGMAGNSFTGTVPQSFSKLIGLSTLDLSGNNLTGTLPESWGKLVGLTGLAMAANSLTATLPQSFSKLTRLQSLEMSQNSLTGTLPVWMSKLTGLVQLGLPGSKCASHPCLLPDWLSKHSWQILSLPGYGFSGTLPAWLSRMATLLNDLNFSSNSFTGTLPGSWRTLEALTSLDLSGNSLTGTLPASWHTLPSLKALLLSDNSLTGNLPAAWSDFYTLERLAIRNNSLSGSVPVVWTSTWWNGSVFTDLARNDFSGPLPPLPASAQYFNASGNRFTGSIASIPDQLLYLHLGANSLTGQLPPVNSSSLVYINLDGNMFTRMPQVFEAPSAVFVSIADNRLSGNIPSFAKNRALVYCDLSGNLLTGLVPNSLFNGTLEYLALASNRLSGTLPRDIEGSISILLLQNNRISGCMPQTWGHNGSASVIVLAGNPVGCDLPKKYADSGWFKNLALLDVSGCNVTGQVPISWMSEKSFRGKDTILRLGSLWASSARLSQKSPFAPKHVKEWRESMCIVPNLNARLNSTLSDFSVPLAVLSALRVKVSAGLANLTQTLVRLNITGVKFDIYDVPLRLGDVEQSSVSEICGNPFAVQIVIIQWGMVCFLLFLMVSAYVLERTFKFSARFRARHAAVSLTWQERYPMMWSLAMAVLSLLGLGVYWYDIVLDVLVLRQIFSVSLPWPGFVLLGVISLHYVIAAGMLAWHFIALHEYLPLFFLLLVPIMPLVDTLVVLVYALQRAGSVPCIQQCIKRVTSRLRLDRVVVDWEGVLDLRNTFATLLQSVPMAVLQSVLFVLGNRPDLGVYLDNWLYLTSAVGSSLQILRMTAGVLFFAARDAKSPWRVFMDLFVLEKVDSSQKQVVDRGWEEL